MDDTRTAEHLLDKVRKPNKSFGHRTVEGGLQKNILTLSRKYKPEKRITRQKRGEKLAAKEIE